MGGGSYSRRIESAFTAKLLALCAFGYAGIALYLLFSASIASLAQPFSRLARLGCAPFRIDRVAIDELLAKCAVIVDVTRPLAGNHLFSHHRSAVAMLNRGAR